MGIQTISSILVYVLLIIEMNYLYLSLELEYIMRMKLALFHILGPEHPSVGSLSL